MTLITGSARVVAGAANNQLSEPRHGAALAERGILYAPDYVINAGGLISALHEMGSCGREEVLARTALIEARLDTIFERSRRPGLAPREVADRQVQERLRRARAARV